MEINKNISTLVELLNNYTIEIPIIQRDYAHGRNDSHSQQVIKTLLKDMKKALISGEELDINFVYGKEEGKKFIPVDGQQRLTTLLLLHIYAYRNDENKTELLKRFTYNTRISSRAFLDKLIENRKDVLSVRKPSKEITDLQWFLDSWKYDPTVISVLNVLDLIVEEMKDVNDIEKILEDSKKCPIRFKFLKMDDLGMEDDLYIKLNSRGRPLTDLENFKAKLLGRMRELNFSENYTTIFENKFDGDWTDYFWKKQKKNFDKYFYSFFEVLLMNYQIIGRNQNLLDLLDFKKIDKKIFDIIFYTLNYISRNNVSPKIDEIITNSLSKGTYPDKVLFHAVTTYFYNSKGEEKESLHQWIRIIKNLVYNSDIDFEESYIDALNSINNFCDNWDNFLEYLVSDAENIRGFKKEQKDEEIIKAKIIKEDKIFAEEIYKAEANKYFKGQIRSALYLAKNDESYSKDVFIKYWSRIEKLFKDDSTQYGNLMRRALLTISDYTMDVNNYKTFCIERPEDSDHNPTMKTLFSSCSPTVKELLDKIDFDDIKDSLNKIVNETNIKQRDWRYCFIKYPSLFAERYMSKNNMRIVERNKNEGMLIVSNKVASGINKSLYLAALYEELFQRGEKDIEFDNERGTGVKHYLILNKYKIKIYFSDNEFIVKEINNEEENEKYKTNKDITDPITNIADYIEDNYKEK